MALLIKQTKGSAFTIMSLSTVRGSFIFDISCITSLCVLGQFLTNLDLFEDFLQKHSACLWLILLIFLLVAFRKNARFNLSRFSFCGMEVAFRENEDELKTSVANWLNSKRMIFVICPEFDNYYDVINSYFETYRFLREKLNNCKSFQQAETDLYKKTLTLLVLIGEFLMKYQSNYRRCYEASIKTNKLEEPFQMIQKSYSLESKMTADFHRLTQMKKIR